MIIKYGATISGGFNGEESWIVGARIGPTQFPIGALFDTEDEARKYFHFKTRTDLKLVKVTIEEV